jgi:hypothetical protein
LIEKKNRSTNRRLSATEEQVDCSCGSQEHSAVSSELLWVTVRAWMWLLKHVLGIAGAVSIFLSSLLSARRVRTSNAEFAYNDILHVISNIFAVSLLLTRILIRKLGITNSSARFTAFV